jgi:LysM repeat protein
MTLASQEATLTFYRFLPTATPQPTSLPQETDVGINLTTQPTPSPGIITATPILMVESDCPHDPDWVQTTVERGDTLVYFSEVTGVSINKIKEENCLAVNTIIPGSVLYLPEFTQTTTPTATYEELACPPPPGWVPYTVERGDNLFRLSRAFRITVPDLQEANCLGNSNLIVRGQILYVPNIPTVSPEPSTTPTRTSLPMATATQTPTLSPPTVTSISPTPSQTVMPPTQKPDTPTPTMTPTPTQTSLPPTSTMTPTPSSTSTLTPTSTSTVTQTQTPQSTAILTQTATATPVNELDRRQ